MSVHGVCTEAGQTEPDLHLSRSGKRWLEVRNSYYRWPTSGPCRSVISHTLEIRLHPAWSVQRPESPGVSPCLASPTEVMVGDLLGASPSALSYTEPSSCPWWLLPFIQLDCLPAQASLGCWGRNQARALVKRREWLFFLPSAQAEWWQAAGVCSARSLRCKLVKRCDWRMPLVPC